MICDRCFKPLADGEHGRFLCPLEPRKVGVSVINDELEGGARWFEHMGHDPVFIESKSQWKREVAARNLVHVDRHDSHYYAVRRKWHDEKLKDTGTPY